MSIATPTNHEQDTGEMRSTVSPPLPPHWYVFRTKARQECLACRNLQQQGYDVFIPFLTQWVKKSGEWKRSEYAMFPRYGFLRLGRQGQSLGPIRSTPGICDLIRFCNEPATLGDAEVEAIRVLSEEQRRLAKARSPFQAGDAVEVSSGPLKGMNGIVSVAAEVRVTVLLSMLGREKPVVLAANELTLA